MAFTIEAKDKNYPGPIQKLNSEVLHDVTIAIECLPPKTSLEPFKLIDFKWNGLPAYAIKASVYARPVEILIYPQDGYKEKDLTSFIACDNPYFKNNGIHVVVTYAGRDYECILRPKDSSLSPGF